MPDRARIIFTRSAFVDPTASFVTMRFSDGQDVGRRNEAGFDGSAAYPGAMLDPRGTASPVGSGASHAFLDALRDRVLVFDGAFGTWMQGHDLGPDDFGGEVLEGCNEYLVLTRPDLVTQMHDDFFRVGVDAVETATFGAFPLVLKEYGIPEAT